MNAIFGIILTISLGLICFLSPDKALSAMLAGGEKALYLSLKMVVIYAVWMGVFALMEKSGISNKFAKLLKPINKFLFGRVPNKANDFMSLNISANVLGMSGATTPMGIKSIEELEKHPDTEYAIAMFFVINATSVQLIPSSVLALRTSLNSSSPADIILPTILATSLSTIIGVLLVKIFLKKRKKKCQFT
ncbi:MAG: spore maturation protein [Clostridia bacterium]|nr:spore maturation protein [Clostridia bacterium]